MCAIRAKRSRPRRRGGVTLLELIVASSLLAATTTAAAAVLSGAHSAWRAHRDDAERISSAHAALRHIVRRVRQAQSISAVSAASDVAGSLTLLAASGSSEIYLRNATTDQVLFGVGAADQLLAGHIEGLSFVGYEADGVTQTIVPQDIRCLESRAFVELTTASGGSREIACRAWLRSW